MDTVMVAQFDCLLSIVPEIIVFHEVAYKERWVFCFKKLGVIVYVFVRLVNKNHNSVSQLAALGKFTEASD